MLRLRRPGPARALERAVEPQIECGVEYSKQFDCVTTPNVNAIFWPAVALPARSKNVMVASAREPMCACGTNRDVLPVIGFSSSRTDSPHGA